MHSRYAPIKKMAVSLVAIPPQNIVYYDEERVFFDSVKLYNSITLKTNTLYKKHCCYFKSALKNNQVYNQILFFISRVIYFYFFVVLNIFL